MMKCILKLFAVIILPFLLQLPLSSQELSGSKWDATLDRYEHICRQCLELKADSNAGKLVPDARLASLMNELQSLKTELYGAGERMPASARRRFEAIRNMYASGIVSETKGLPAPPCLPCIMARPPAIAPQSCISGQAAAAAPSIAYAWTVSPSMIVLPEFSAGFMAGYCRKRIGAFAAFRSNFSFHDTSYSALSDGTSSGLPVWTSGKAAVDRFFLTAGPLVRLSDLFSVYGGLGYGERKLCWEDSEGLWMEVSDASRRGLCTELGLSVNAGRFVVSAGWLSLPFSYNALTLSVGWTFGPYLR